MSLKLPTINPFNYITVWRPHLKYIILQRYLSRSRISSGEVVDVIVQVFMIVIILLSSSSITVPI